MSRIRLPPCGGAYIRGLPTENPEEPTGFGVAVLNGITSVQNVDILNAVGYGIVQNSSNAVSYDDIFISDSLFAGMYLVSPSPGTVITNTTIVDTYADGIRTMGGSLEIGLGVQIDTAGQIGVNADGAAIEIHDAVISYCEGGAQSSNNGSLDIADTIFSDCYFGVGTQPTGTADLSDGGSYFGRCTGYYIMNGNENHTIQAAGNCFGGIVPPSGRMFIGLGPIVYNPSICD